MSRKTTRRSLTIQRSRLRSQYFPASRRPRWPQLRDHQQIVFSSLPSLSSAHERLSVWADLVDANALRAPIHGPTKLPVSWLFCIAFPTSIFLSALVGNCGFHRTNFCYLWFLLRNRAPIWRPGPRAVLALINASASPTGLPWPDQIVASPPAIYGYSYLVDALIKTPFGAIFGT